MSMSEHAGPREPETIAEAAKRYGVNPRTIRRRIADGTLTGYRIGPRSIRLDPAEVDAALMRPIPSALTGLAIGKGALADRY